MTKHKEDCLSINSKLSVKLEEGTIEFENYSKQIPVPFKVYANFECNLRGVESYEGSYTKNIMITFFVALLTKLFVLMIGLLSQLLFIKVKMLLMNLLKQFLTKVMNKHFNKNLIISEKEEHLFQQSNSCRICKNLIDNDDEKVKDHCHMTGKLRGSAYWNCNIIN